MASKFNSSTFFNKLKTKLKGAANKISFNVREDLADIDKKFNSWRVSTQLRADEAEKQKRIKIDDRNKFIKEGLGRVKTGVMTHPWTDLLPLSWKSAAQPLANQVGAPALGRYLRGATSITPFQAQPHLLSIPISPVLNKKERQREDVFAPTTEKEKAQERLGRNVYGAALTAPLGGPNLLKNLGTRAVQGTILGTALGTGGRKLKGEEITAQTLKEDAMTGFENSWQLALTNLATDKLVMTKFVKGFPFLGKYFGGLTDDVAIGALKEISKSPAKMKATMTAAKLLFLRALAEVPMENTLFTATNMMNQDDKESYFKRWWENLPAEIVANIAYAGVQTVVGVPYQWNKDSIDGAMKSVIKSFKAIPTKIKEKSIAEQNKAMQESVESPYLPSLKEAMEGPKVEPEKMMTQRMPSPEEGLKLGELKQDQNRISLSIKEIDDTIDNYDFYKQQTKVQTKAQVKTDEPTQLNAVGIIAGMEQDEDGNWTFDPKKAAIGLVAGQVVGKDGVKRLIKDVKLPFGLSGAKPRFGFGAKGLFEVKFKSDIDKALYIVAGKTPSKSDEKYMEFLRETLTGKSDSEIRAMGIKVKAVIKNMIANDISVKGQVVTLPGLHVKATSAQVKAKPDPLNQLKTFEDVEDYLLKKYPSGIDLYHQTSKGAEVKIKKDGFRGNDDGDVYFSAISLERGRATSGGNDGLIKITIKPEDYGKLGADRGTYAGDTDEKQMVDMIKQGFDKADVLLENAVANKYLKQAQKISAEPTKAEQLAFEEAQIRTAEAEMGGDLRTELGESTIKDINTLKQVAKSEAVQTGDIETLRTGKHGQLTNRVVESVQEVRPGMEEAEALGIALNLPTKASTVVKKADTKIIEGEVKEPVRPSPEALPVKLLTKKQLVKEKTRLSGEKDKISLEVKKIQKEGLPVRKKQDYSDVATRIYAKEADATAKQEKLARDKRPVVTEGLTEEAKADMKRGGVDLTEPKVQTKGDSPKDATDPAEIVNILDNSTKEWYGKRKSADVRKVAVQRRFVDLDEGELETIFKFQDGDTSNPQFNAARQMLEELRLQENAAGIPVEKKAGYLYQLWDFSKPGDEAAYDRYVNLNPQFAKESIIDSYRTGIELRTKDFPNGLTPKYTKMSEILAARASASVRSIADKEFFDRNAKFGTFLPGGKQPKDWDALDPKRMPFKEQMYAPKEYAKKINSYLNPVTWKEDPLKAMADINSYSKALFLTGGVPGTAINFYGWKTFFNNMKSYPLKEGGFIRGLFDAKYFIKPALASEKINLEELEEAVKYNLVASAEDYSLPEQMLKSMKDDPAYKKLGKGYKNWLATTFENPLFKQTIPYLKLNRWKQITADLMKSGKYSEAEAKKIAAEQTNSLLAGVNTSELFRSRGWQNLWRTLFLAPDLYESQIKQIKGMGKGVLSPKNPEFKAYRTIMANVALMYVVDNIINKATSGHWMYENEPGNEFSIEGGYAANGEKRYFTGFTGLIDWVRIPFTALAGLVKGDMTPTLQIIRNRLSPVSGLFTSTVTNTDWLSRKIVKPDDSLGKQLMAVGGEVGGYLVPTFASGLLSDVTTGRTPAFEQTLVRGLELPIRYKGGQYSKTGIRTKDTLMELGYRGEELYNKLNDKPKQYEKKDGKFNWWGLFGGKDEETEEPTNDVEFLSQMLVDEKDLSDKKKRIKQIFEMGLKSEEEIQEALDIEDLGSFEDAMITIVDSLGVENGKKGQAIWHFLEKTENEEGWLEVFNNFAEKRLLTTNVTKQWVIEGTITPEEKEIMDSLIKKAKGVATGTGSSKKKISLSLPKIPSTQMKLPTFKPIQVKAPSAINVGFNIPKAPKINTVNEGPPSIALRRDTEFAKMPTRLSGIR